MILVGQEPTFRDQENLDDEEKVDYKPATNTYLTESDNADDEPSLETMGGSIPASGNFEPVANLDGISGVLQSDLAVEMTIDLALVHILATRHRLVVSKSSNEDNDASISPVPVGVWRQKGEFELKSIELTKEWDFKFSELETETKRLAAVITQAIPIDPRDLRERVQKNVHKAKDSRIAK
ncbi:uncharacterized protein A4U43_C01F20670 [Asparagus officinalis]|uniref:Uncharacterized protein n=1 Tax=Asparagus officinalis TaxID=4686 RepID=A0A5P1FRH6_ASPOF|nr:uncharacterized protein A4U43_C01F20670 [Asparagus officinalis]